MREARPKGSINFVFSAISAAVSMTTAWYTASAAIFPPGKRPVVPYKSTGHGKRLVSAASHSFYNDGTRNFSHKRFSFLLP